MRIVENIPLFYVFICLLFNTNLLAQNIEKFSFSPYAKTHKFYDVGTYKIGNSSTAKTKGIGVNVNFDLAKRLKLIGGYSFSMVDSLKYGDNVTSNAELHQVELNAAVNLPSVSVVNPYIYFGYQFNALPQLRSLDLKSNGWNANFGVGTEFKINPSLGIHYSLTYGFSFSDNIRHNFEHQFGVVVHPSKFYKRTIQPTLNYQKEKIITQTIDLGNLNLENDSLKKLLTKLDNLALLKASNKVLVSRVEKLQTSLTLEKQLKSNALEKLKTCNTSIDSLKKENKALTQLKDSIEKTEFLNSNYLVNIEGVKLTNQNLIKGYYLIFDELLELSEVDSVLKNEYYINFENKFIKKIGDFYQVLGFLSVSEETAKIFKTDMGADAIFYQITNL